MKMSKKHRDYVTPSSIGSYFGVGFNDPYDQLQVDLGLEDNNFDDEARARMLLGTVLEESVLITLNNCLVSLLLIEMMN